MDCGVRFGQGPPSLPPITLPNQRLRQQHSSGCGTEATDWPHELRSSYDKDGIFLINHVGPSDLHSDLLIPAYAEAKAILKTINRCFTRILPACALAAGSTR